MQFLCIAYMRDIFHTTQGHIPELYIYYSPLLNSYNMHTERPIFKLIYRPKIVCTPGKITECGRRPNGRVRDVPSLSYEKDTR